MIIQSRGGLTQIGVGGGEGVSTRSNKVVKQPYKMAY